MPNAKCQHQGVPVSVDNPRAVATDHKVAFNVAAILACRCDPCCECPGIDGAEVEVHLGGDHVPIGDVGVAQNVIDVEVGRRRRAMDRKLQGVELLPEIEAVAVLELDGPDELAEEPERYAAE